MSKRSNFESLKDLPTMPVTIGSMRWNRTGNWRDLFKQLNKINSLTVEDLQRVAQKYLDPNIRIVSFIEKPEESM